MATKTQGIDHKMMMAGAVRREFFGPTSTDDGYTFRSATVSLRVSGERIIRGNGRGGNAREALSAALYDLSRAVLDYENAVTERAVRS